MKNIIIIFVVFLSLFSTAPLFAATSILGTTDDGPTAIVVDKDGNVYTANQNADTVSKITPLGVSSILGTTGSFPSAITVDDDGNIYVANANSNNVSKITPLGVSSILGTTGNFPVGIVLDNDGNVYTANRDDSTISKITPAGVSTILVTLGASFPYGIVLDTDGNIYTPNSASDNVSKTTPGGVTTIFANTGPSPLAITIDSDGNIYTANNIAFSNGNVTKITPDGISSIVGSVGRFPTGIVIDEDDNIYVTNSSDDNVTRINPAGVSSIIGLTEVAPTGITIDEEGNLYIANRDSDSVTKIVPPRIKEVTPVVSPSNDTTPEYTFNTNLVGTIQYGGSCFSSTATSIAGDNTIIFNALAEGTYSNCTIIVSDGVDITDTLTISSFTINSPTVITEHKNSQGRSGQRVRTEEEINEIFGIQKKEVSTENPFGGIMCPENLIIHNYLKKGDRDGKYSRYNLGIVTEVNILQQHINRLLLDEYGNQAAGPIDGIFEVLTKRGVTRLQTRLNQLLPKMVPLVIDGIVGPFTKQAINHSCGEILGRELLINEIEKLQKQLSL